MISYFDTSSIVPLLLDESGSAIARKIWQDASQLMTSQLTYVEARAALAQATRLGRIDPHRLTMAVAALGALLDEAQPVEVTESLVRRGGELAERHALRGYDAMHLASAELVMDDETVLVSGDRALCDAAAELGLVVAPT